MSSSHEVTAPHATRRGGIYGSPGVAGDDVPYLLFRRVAWGTALFVTITNIAVLIAQPDTLWRVLQNIVVIGSMVWATVWLAGRGRLRTAAWIYVWVLVLLVTVNAIPFGGIRSPGVPAFMIFVMLAGLLLGWRASVGMASACAMIGLGLVMAERWGLLPDPPSDYTALVRWMLICMYMGVTLLAMYLATERIRTALEAAKRDLAERERAESELGRVVADLGERIKELRLLHDAGRLLQQARGLDRELLRRLAERIPAAWSHADDACARIVVADIEATSPEWRESPWIQSASCDTTDGPCLLQVAYRNEHPPADEGPFLEEERSLIDSLAEMLRTYIERQAVERRRDAAESQLRQAQKMEAVGTLAAGIAHDFNNILGAIGGNAQLAALDTPAGSLAAEGIKEILMAHSRAADLVRRILLFGSHPESSRQSIALAPIIDEALQLLRATLPGSIRIRTAFSPQLPSVRADPTQMHQMVMNLVTNAAHAMRQNGGILSIGLTTIHIDSEGALPSPDLIPGDYLRLAIADTGTGMTPEVRERLFEPFFTTKGSAGTGLGLSVVHGIVREHGGAISVTTEPGAGSEFVIYLPAQQSAEVESPPLSRTLVHGAGQTVMYVDDEANLCQLMRRMLDHLGYRARTYTDPLTALREFQDMPDDFDVVVSDLQMPGMSGLELARAIRDVRPDTRIVIVSGNTADHVGGGSEPDSIVWLSKPLSLEDLGVALGRIVNGDGHT